MERLQRIDISDRIVFSGRDEAMEACFSPYKIAPRVARLLDVISLLDI